MNKDIPVLKTRVPLNLKTIETFKDLKKSLGLVEKKQEKIVTDIIRKLIDKPFQTKEEETLNEFVIESLENKQFKGQIIRDDEKVLYVSLITTQKWKKNANWYEADSFKI